MKIYAVVEHYYDYCNVWDSYDSFWTTEERAYERLLEIQAQYEDDGVEVETTWVDVDELEVD